MADQFHSTMNNLHPKLKFEIEKPEITSNGHSLSLLDFKVTISEDGKSSFEIGKKENNIRSPPISGTEKNQRSTSFVMSENSSKINALQKRQPQSIKIVLTTSFVSTVILRAL